MPSCQSFLNNRNDIVFESAQVGSPSPATVRSDVAASGLRVAAPTFLPLIGPSSSSALDGGVVKLDTSVKSEDQTPGVAKGISRIGGLDLASLEEVRPGLFQGEADILCGVLGGLPRLLRHG